MDQRRYQRWALEAPVTYSWKDAGGIRHRTQGTVKNISGAGVFVSTHEPPARGARVRLRVFFSSFHGASVLVMKMIGQVVRVESGLQAEAHGGFAVAFKSYILRDETRVIEQRSF
jgi:PilZ domain